MARLADAGFLPFAYSIATFASMRGYEFLRNGAALHELPAKLKTQPLMLHKAGKLAVPFFLPSFALNGISVRLLNRVIAFVQNSPKAFVHYEKFFFPLDAISNWNKGYGKRGFIQYQFVIPEDQGKKNLTEILQVADRIV